MSKCISRHGEYSEHVIDASLMPDDDRFVCKRCWVFDEDAAMCALSAAEARVETLQRQVELIRSIHREIPASDPMGNSGFCTGCDYRYPCPTIRAINLPDDIAAALAAVLGKPQPTEEEPPSGA